MPGTSPTPRSSGFPEQTSLSWSDLADLPLKGWDFEYVQLEPDRRGRPIFRPAVPIRLSADQPNPVLALVDSGCEHCLCAAWIADSLGIDLANASDTLELGIGGRTVTAAFVEVDLQLHRYGRDDEFVTWKTDVGFIKPWDAQFFMILGQTGFFDEFAVTMSRRLLTVVIENPEDLHLRRS